MNVMKKILSALLRLAAVVSIIAIPASFVFGGNIVRFLEPILGIRVDPGFTGGAVMASFLDDAGDDTGEGGLSYPLHEAWAAGGAADLVGYEVRRPMVDARWSSEIDYWQLTLSFASLGDPLRGAAGFSGVVASVYIDTDGAASGSTATAADRVELVGFPAEYPWDLMVAIHGDRATATMVTASGETRDIPMIVVEERGEVHVRLPLDLPETARVLDGRPTRHWVLAGVHDPLAAGGWMAVRSTAALRSGGGARSSLTPKVYDAVLPEGWNQAEVLSSYDEASGRLATLPPLVVGGFDPLTDYRDAPSGDVAPRAEDAVTRYAALAAAERAEGEAAGRAEAEALLASDDPVERVGGLFALGRYDEAVTAVDAVLADRPDDPAAVAYKGSLVAMSAGRASSNPAEAVRLVQEAYVFLDRAVSLGEAALAAAGPADPAARTALATAIMNRANVSMSVPEEVFQKSLQGAADFERIGAMAEEDGNGARAAGAYVQAALCMETAGKDAEARVLFLRVRAIANRPASASLELAKRGYIKE